MTQYIIPIVGGVLLYKLGTNLMEKTGIAPDKVDTKGENAQIKLNEAEFWAPDFYQKAAQKAKPKQISIPTYATARAIADKIYNAKGYTYDNEETAVGAIRSCKSKAHISRVSEVFFQTYGVDLYGYLYSYLEASDWFQIQAHIKNIPAYIIYSN